MATEESKQDNVLKTIGLLIGPSLFVLIARLEPFPLSPEANRVLGVAVWMLSWWILESVPLAVTALLPMLLFPLLGVMSAEDAAKGYANPIVYLFFGGFMLALGLEEHGLHKRIALMIIRFTGFSPARLILGFMLSTALLSMWISNTATAIMMLPMAISVLNLMSDNGRRPLNQQFSIALILSIAYAANIGGMATLIGSPPNLVMAAQLREFMDIEVSFMAWLIVALPVSAVTLIAIYFLLVAVLYPCRRTIIQNVERIFADEEKKLGKMGFAERSMLFVFLTTASLWVLRGWLEWLFPNIAISDTTIALAAAVSLFIVPARIKNYQPLLEWKATTRLPWGILLLFGGGLSLAGALGQVGVIDALGDLVAQRGDGRFWLTLVLLTAVALYLTEVMSNVALVSVFVPVLCGIAIKMEMHPLYFTFPATLASSCAFMLPMATPPNAIVFSTGKLTIKNMVNAGFWCNLLALIVVLLLTQLLLPLAFDLSVESVPKFNLGTR
ncbi:MAG TPA: DASS family sodium-coupled anion symporter [Pirellulaceae bacterium]|nr:DASS family sodium-coupled anion symporter [Pirellulaceae bacterium]HMO92058.1 DASS family sodium-coupled anion symporter [Pirellulaceae bacterium]HMP69934.1 DASS family sodium-coupled anion symporter [Pirellulaceae bacterium]